MPLIIGIIYRYYIIDDFIYGAIQISATAGRHYHFNAAAICQLHVMMILDFISGRRRISIMP